MQRNEPQMSSLEAAALIMSDGKTTDVEQAELMAEGKLLDPDALTRAYYRRAMGFNFSVTPEPDKHRYIVRNDETGDTQTVSMTGNADKDGSKITRAVMRLKKRYDAIDADEVV